MNAYKVIYWDECENLRDMWNHIEIVKENGLVKYVEWLEREGRICEENIEIFKEKHPLGVQTEQDAMELLQLDGYLVEEIVLY